MPPRKAKAKTASRRPRRTASKPKMKASARRRSAPAPETPVPSDPRFVRDVVTRGEAASLTPDGRLPQDATHVITGGAADTATIKRARFKAF